MSLINPTANNAPPPDSRNAVFSQTENKESNGLPLNESAKLDFDMEKELMEKASRGEELTLRETYSVVRQYLRCGSTPDVAAAEAGLQHETHLELLKSDREYRKTVDLGTMHYIMLLEHRLTEYLLNGRRTHTCRQGVPSDGEQNVWADDFTPVTGYRDAIKYYREQRDFALNGRPMPLTAATLLSFLQDVRHTLEDKVRDSGLVDIITGELTQKLQVLLTGVQGTRASENTKAIQADRVH